MSVIEKIQNIIKENDSAVIIFDKIKELSKEESHPQVIFDLAELEIASSKDENVLQDFKIEKYKNIAFKFKQRTDEFKESGLGYDVYMEGALEYAKILQEQEKMESNINVMDIFAGYFKDSYSEEFEKLTSLSY